MNQSIRTDLAMEARELDGAMDGISEETINGRGYTVSRTKIETDAAAKRLGKEKGLYITVDAPELPYGTSKFRQSIINVLADELMRMIGERRGTVLVAALGNRAVTPDALGPRTAEQIYVTRHIKKYMPDSLPKDVRSVCAVSPGVLGVTGIETTDILYGAVKQCKPELIIAIDSLASRRTERIGSTIQLCDCGLQPGAGVGNARRGINCSSMGVPVIAIGVPLVVYASTISRDTIELIADKLSLPSGDERIKELAANAISEKTGELIVTPKEIDSLISTMSEVLSSGINSALLGDRYDDVRSFIA